MHLSRNFHHPAWLLKLLEQQGFLLFLEGLLLLLGSGEGLLLLLLGSGSVDHLLLLASSPLLASLLASSPLLALSPLLGSLAQEALRLLDMISVRGQDSENEAARKGDTQKLTDLNYSLLLEYQLLVILLDKLSTWPHMQPSTQGHLVDTRSAPHSGEVSLLEFDRALQDQLELLAAPMESVTQRSGCLPLGLKLLDWPFAFFPSAISSNDY